MDTTTARVTLARYLKQSPLVLVPALALGALLLTALSAAILSWSVLYRSVVPNVGRREPVWLQYGSVPPACPLHRPLVLTSRRLHSHHRPPFASVPLGPAGSFLSSDQNYDITLEFVVPNTVRNVKLGTCKRHIRMRLTARSSGNFMVNVALLTKDQRTLVNVSRPVRLPSPSAVLMLIKSQASLVYQAPLALHLASVSPFSFKPKTQHLAITLVESEVLQSRGKIPTTAFVQLGRQDAHLGENGNGLGWHGGEGELQVYRAWLRFDAHLTGLRWLLYFHPIISFLIFTPSFLLAELIAAFSIWAFIAYRSEAMGGESDSPLTGTFGSGSSYSDEEEDDKRGIKLESQEGGVRRRIPRMETESGGVLAGSGSGSGEEEDFSSSASSWQGVEEETETERPIKEEDEDSASTVGGVCSSLLERGDTDSRSASLPRRVERSPPLAPLSRPHARHRRVPRLLERRIRCTLISPLRRNLLFRLSNRFPLARPSLSIAAQPGLLNAQTHNSLPKQNSQDQFSYSSLPSQGGEWGGIYERFKK